MINLKFILIKIIKNFQIPLFFFASQLFVSKKSKKFRMSKEPFELQLLFFYSESIYNPKLVVFLVFSSLKPEKRIKYSNLFFSHFSFLFSFFKLNIQFYFNFYFLKYFLLSRLLIYSITIKKNENARWEIWLYFEKKF